MRKPSLRLLSLSGLVRENYAGKQIPTSTGATYVVSAFLAAVITVTPGGLTGYRAQEVVPCLLLVIGSSFVGLIDDVFGTHAARGFMGHIKALVIKRTVTTGLLKAVIVWLLAASAITVTTKVRSPLTLVFDATLISLAANFINLLDLQPARSGKVFSISIALLLVCDHHSCIGMVPVGLAGAVLSGFNDELHEKSMIGDAGSNSLGAALGYWVALRLSPIIKAFILLFLVGVHIYSERYSLSRTIDENSVLRFIDRLGRS
jgi:UDP-N-acetylmuramyl pentapeptide phosphotransferase/UDP-N-acetylglucosamine-1-phosphate transferase